ncbi:glycosyltransferase family 4 protein [Tamlana agarivorans]|uniref:Glycosyltransferase family 4 protein n=1 Tax=Pseudotamlana agarivorans TaxID=481183 RepID=A0ACC5U7J8_9FLAO|nr:glycosyltransferase family 4 protein [Tamlana agarivorans]MBU2950243.1 glycosyltransferase family 4 protein [Tamlana agarivorans]
MKLGYFTHTNVSPSETFIFDLISALQDDEDINITVYGGNKKHKIKGIDGLKTISTGYSEKGYKNSFKLYKLGQFLGGKGNHFKNKFQIYNGYHALKNNIINKPDVAFIDYGTSAVMCRKYMVDNKIPFIVHVHGYDVTSALNDEFYKKELKKVFESASYIIAASHYIRKILELEGCSKEKIKVIRYGLNSSQVKPLNWNKRKNENPSVIFLGRLTPKKHPIALLHAFNIVQRKIPNAKLTIIGSGPLENAVKKCIDKLGIKEKVDMLGVLNREQSFPIMNKHWVYAQHSVTASSGDQEGFAISLAEAAIHEIPVVSTYHNGIPENVLDKETGLLVKEFDFEDMAKKIIYLIENPDVAEKMGKAGREHIINLCCTKTRVEKIKELVKSSIKKTI